MAKVLPKKPARYYPANLVHGIRVSLNAAPNPAAGEIGIKAGKYHIGTLPAGAMLMPVTATIATAFTAGATLSIGDEANAANFVASADIAPGTAVVAKQVTPLIGKVAVDTPLYLTIAGTAAVAGAGDILIPYYASRD